MPNRPRSHALESLSRAAFETLINVKNWVFEPFHNDYGIDGRVEIFHSEKATGKLFYVQLKATDAESMDDILKSQLRVDTLNYLRSTDTPVCLVRYSATTDTFFIKWILAFDEYRGIQPEQESVTLHFSKQDIFKSAADFERLELSFDTLRKLKSPVLEMPIPLKVVYDEGLSEDVRRSLAQIFSNLVHESAHFYLAPKSFLICITFTEKIVTVTIPGVHHFEIDLLETPSSDKSKPLIFDVFAIIALNLAGLGRVKEAGKIVLDYLPLSQLLQSESGLTMVSRVIQQSSSQSECIFRMKEAVESKNLNAAQLYLGYSISLFHEPTSKNNDDIYNLVRKMADIARHIGNNDLAGAMLFNAAAYLRLAGDCDKALRMLDLAVLTDSSGKQRYHWQLEYGRLYFLLERFKEGAEAYLKAYELVQPLHNLRQWTHEILLLAADCLLHNGEYNRASKTFDKAWTQSKYINEEFHLRNWVVQALMSQGYTSQIRDRSGAKKFLQALDVIDYRIQQKDTFDQVKEILAKDSINAEAWYRLGVWHSFRQEIREAQTCFLIGATLEPVNLNYWLNYFKASHILGKSMNLFVFACAVAVAYTYHEYDLITAFEQELGSEVGSEAIDKFLEITDGIAHKLARSRDQIYTVSTPWGTTTVPWTRPPLIISAEA